MITKNELRDSLIHELKVIRTLMTKLPEGAGDYRPSPDQRSTLELAHYLCKVGQGCVRAGLEGSFEWFGSEGGRYDSLRFAEIPAVLDQEITEISRLFAEMTDEDFADKTVDMQAAGMGTWKLQGWLLNTALKFTAAYKLQLFLYAKAAGNGALDTFDAWMDTGGVPRPTPANS